ncbi:MAG: ABC transporter permease, partial [Clostridia bacterium]
MAQFFNVLSFEYRAFLRKKSFWITTLLAMLVVAGVLFFPTLLARFSPDQHAPLPDGASAPVLLLQDASHDGKTAQAFAQALPHYQWVDAADVSLAADTADAFASRITSALEEERYHAALFIAPDGTLTWIQKRIQMMGDETTIVQETAQRILTEHKLAAWGLSPAQTQDALTKPTLQVIETGKSMTQTYLYTYAMIFLLYFSLVLYGTMIASNVATEKSSRTMEVLITSARPINLLFGKVIGTCLAGLTQLTVILLTCVLCYRMAMPAWAGNPLIAALFDIPAHILFAMIGFYLLGFFLYGFLYGGLG